MLNPLTHYSHPLVLFNCSVSGPRFNDRIYIYMETIVNTESTDASIEANKLAYRKGWISFVLKVYSKKANFYTLFLQGPLPRTTLLPHPILSFSRRSTKSIISVAEKGIGVPLISCGTLAIRKPRVCI